MPFGRARAKESVSQKAQPMPSHAARCSAMPNISRPRRSSESQQGMEERPRFLDGPHAVHPALAVKAPVGTSRALRAVIDVESKWMP